MVRSWVGHVDPEIMRLYTHISSKTSQERIKLFKPDLKDQGETDVA